jgi:glycosyltransferase involved in cell wall biosynthesis
VKHEDVAGLLSCYDVLFLPTLGENFGHVIGEALSVGLPVLISDRTPWKGIQESGAGWVIPIEDRRQFVTVITSLADSAPEDRRGFSRNAERYYTRYASEHDALQRNREMLGRALNEVRRESYACKAL